MSVEPPDVEAIRARAEKATPGPWFAWRATTVFIGWTVQIAAGWLFQQSDKAGEHDAEFIAHARTDVPALCDALDAERARRHRAEEAMTATVAASYQRAEAAEQALAEARTEIARLSAKAEDPQTIHQGD